jgi:aminoglycoside phosphotransferase (APT) family kinase protein
MNTMPEGLWEIGTYWHLTTRPDELEALEDLALKKVAPLIDAKLNAAQFKTFVHGDAKVANFCFSEDGKRVAAVDFQYVGGGCGVKDLAYFLGSCLSETQLDQKATNFKDYYFTTLGKALKNRNIPFTEVEKEWRALYPYAVADFHRFLKGWSPGHWKINSYSERISKEITTRF